MFKKLFLGFFVLTLTGCETPQMNMNIDPAVLIKRVTPVYPAQARADKTEGWIWVRYTVTNKGLVIDPVVTRSDPKAVFDDAALLAIYQFEYSPRQVDGKPTSITGMTYRFEFKL